MKTIMTTMTMMTMKTVTTMMTMSNQASAPDLPATRPLEELEALRRDLEAIEVPRRLWWTIRLRLFLAALRQPRPTKAALLRSSHAEHRLGIVLGQHRLGVVAGLHRIGLASAACLVMLAWVGLSGSIIDMRQAPDTRLEANTRAEANPRVGARALAGVSARVQGLQGSQGAQVSGGALLPGGSRSGLPDLVSIVGMESLAMLGLPYLGSGDLASSAATRSGEWVTLPGSEVFALRLLD